MGIPDPILNCILAVCCPPDAAQQAFAKAIVEAGVCDREHAPKCAEWVFEYFDLAPKGSLVQLKADIAKLARGTRG